MQPSSLLLLSLRCRTRGLFFLQAMDMQIEQVHCRTAVVSDLPYGGAGPPVRLLSLTSFSAGDLVPRPCMSSSYGCASCRLCLLRDRVFDCPRALVPTSFPQLLDWLLSFQQVLLYPRSYGGTGPPGPGEWACWTFLLTPTPCLTPSCDKRTRRGSCAQEEGAAVFLRGRKTSQGTPWGVCAHGGCSLVPCRG